MDHPKPLTDADVLELTNKLMAYAARQGLALPPLRMVSGAITLDPERSQRWAKAIADHAYAHRDTPGAQEIVDLMLSVAGTAGPEGGA